MSYLLFLDESGHDHKNTPYEVRGGVAIHDKRLGQFISAIRRLEGLCFGTLLHRYGSEIKGSRLLEKKRYRWASQESKLDDKIRRKESRNFLNKGMNKQKPTYREFTAYGQASLGMVSGIYKLCEQYDVKIFAGIIPSTVKKPVSTRVEKFLRKDQVFLFERFYYFLEDENETGIIVMDESSRTDERKFLDHMTGYFSKTMKGKVRRQRIVPHPFFVASDMTYPIQVADVIIYCINYGFRLPNSRMSAPVRQEIQRDFRRAIDNLQFRGLRKDNKETHELFGIVFVPDPYGEDK